MYGSYSQNNYDVIYTNVIESGHPPRSGWRVDAVSTSQTMHFSSGSLLNEKRALRPPPTITYHRAGARKRRNLMLMVRLQMIGIHHSVAENWTSGIVKPLGPTPIPMLALVPTPPIQPQPNPYTNPFAPDDPTDPFAPLAGATTANYAAPWTEDTPMDIRGDADDFGFTAGAIDDPFRQDVDAQDARALQDALQGDIDITTQEAFGYTPGTHSPGYWNELGARL